MILSFVNGERRAVLSLSLLYIVRVLGLFLLYPVLATYASGLEGQTPLWIGLSLGIYGLSQAFLQIPMGLLSDYLGRKPVITLGLVMMALGSLMAAEARSIEMFTCARFIQGAGAISGVCAALLADTVHETRRSMAMAVIGIGIGMTFTVSLVLGPWLAAKMSVSGLFTGMAMLALLGLLIVWFGVPHTPRQWTRLHWRESLHELFKFPPVWFFAGSVTVLHAILAAMFMILPQQLITLTGQPLETFTGIYALGMGCILIIALTWMRQIEKQGQQKHGLLMAITLMFFSQIIACWPGEDLVSFAVSLFIFFLAFNVLEAVLPAWLSRAVPDALRGAAMGVFTTGQFLGVFLGGVLAGFIIKYWPEVDIHFIFIWVILVWLIVAKQFSYLAFNHK